MSVIYQLSDKKKQEIIVALIIMVIFFVLGKLFSKGKCLNLLAGYNALNKEEKENVNKNKIKKVASFVMYGGAILALCSIGASLTNCENMIKWFVVLFVVFDFSCIYWLNKK